jgi:hypothetical protein
MRQSLGAGAQSPSFSWWEPDADATYEKFAGMPLEDVCALAMSTRTHLLTAIKDLTPEQWGATAKHETFGTIDIAGLIIQILTHDEEHRASLI